MSPSTPSSRLSEIMRIAEGAAQSAGQFFRNRSDLAVSQKTPEQAVTEADRSVEAEIIAAIAKQFPGEPVLGEEFGGDVGQSFWTIDPIDGTANFLNGLPLWGVAVGHVKDGVPDLGAISLPELGLNVAGEAGAVFLNGAPHVRRGPVIPSLSVGHCKAENVAEMLDLLRLGRVAGLAPVQIRCSAVSLAWVALGQLSGHVHRGTTPWDLVPGAAICLAAGVETRFNLSNDQEMWIKAGDALVHDTFGQLWEGQG